MDIRIQIPEPKIPEKSELEKTMLVNFNKGILEELRAFRELLSKLANKKEDTRPLEKTLGVMEKIIGTLPSIVQGNENRSTEEISQLKSAMQAQTNKLVSTLKEKPKNTELDGLINAVSDLEKKLSRLSLQKTIVIQEKDNRPTIVPWPC
jgi:hypothetical protein